MMKKEPHSGHLILGISLIAFALCGIFVIYAYAAGMAQGGDLTLRSGGLEFLLGGLIGLSMLSFIAGIILGSYFEARQMKEKI